MLFLQSDLSCFPVYMVVIIPGMYSYSIVHIPHPHCVSVFFDFLFLTSASLRVCCDLNTVLTLRCLLPRCIFSLMRRYSIFQTSASLTNVNVVTACTWHLIHYSIPFFLRSRLLDSNDKTLLECVVTWILVCCDLNTFLTLRCLLPERVKEHRYTVRTRNMNNGHAWDNDHHVDWEAAKVRLQEQHHWKRKVLEAIHIQREEKTSNLDIGLSINPIWTPVLNSPNSLSQFSCSFPSVANG